MQRKVENAPDLRLSIEMSNKLFAIAKITRASGLKGEVGVRPLVRQFDDYVTDNPCLLVLMKPLPGM
jgi:ribosomal 30S subunit maturation factor RimM